MSDRSPACSVGGDAGRVLAEVGACGVGKLLSGEKLGVRGAGARAGDGWEWRWPACWLDASACVCVRCLCMRVSMCICVHVCDLVPLPSQTE